ncbi:hypothetical protein [Clostridium frigidicarnis]|uniref:Uncharacterized protein n=1 Tax=Clostridium frigidicarnis TaxID=84698 RepID=A0A1I0Z7P1_9CLOT|nr:hypothetical protein [Clostridium frigidicarnis]SFB21655.1 hypothetical protein SAMN04488528_101829 [Clostridium frigidicarnis]
MASSKDDLKARARQMLINGDEFEKIEKDTGLRQKDLKRIQKEISSHF